MLRPFINADENINLTNYGGVWGFVEKYDTYIVAGVMVVRGKWYLLCFRRGVVSFDLFFFSGGVRWVMCMGQSVREGVRSHAYMLKGFQIFYLVDCFVMGTLWWLIFHGGKGGIFYVFLYGGTSFNIYQVIVGKIFMSFRCHMYKDKEVLNEQFLFVKESLWL